MTPRAHRPQRARHLDGRSSTLCALLACCAALVSVAAVAGQAGEPEMAPHSGLLSVLAGVWLVLCAAVVVRGRLRTGEVAVVLGVASVVVTATGVLVPVVAWQLLCLGTQPLLLVLAVPLVRSRQLSVLQVLTAVGTAAVVSRFDLTGAFGVYAALCWAGMVVLPSTVVSVLVARLEAARSRAEALAVTDALTGLLNRRGLLRSAPPLVREAAAAGDRLGVLLLDVDRFKTVNDTHGHRTGDQVLQEVAGAVRGALRRCDVVVRWGGEEVAVLTRVRHDEELRAVAERVRRAVAGLLVPGLPPVTASVGATSAVVTPLPGAGGTDPSGEAAVVDLVSRLLDRADEALYEAKSSGRDRVALHRPAVPSPRSPAESAETVAL